MNTEKKSLFEMQFSRLRCFVSFLRLKRVRNPY